MPGFDRSGPMGAGPMTGGRRGRCNPNTAAAIPQGYAAGYGRGYGMGRGFRGGVGYGAAVPPVYTAGPTANTDEVHGLQAAVEELRAALGRIEERLGGMTRNDEP